MAYSLIALQPDYAESILDFRYRQLGAAIENSQEYNRLAQEPGYYLRQYNYSSNSALYPWTAGRFGNATVSLRNFFRSSILGLHLVLLIGFLRPSSPSTLSLPSHPLILINDV